MYHVIPGVRVPVCLQIWEVIKSSKSRSGSRTFLKDFSTWQDGSFPQFDSYLLINRYDFHKNFGDDGDDDYDKDGDEDDEGEESI